MSNERTGVLELALGDSYIGSAYSPQVEVTDTDTGHEVAITYMSPSGLVTERFDVEDGATGPQGPAGYSPTVTITDTPTGHTVTITDAQGPHSYFVPNYAQEEQRRQDAWDALSGEVADAISDAETATSAASTAATSATNAATSANTAAQAATTAASGANTAASSANAAATAANSAASAAGTAADAATTAAGDATDAASAANTAAQAAQEAATEVAPEVEWLWGNQLTGTLTGDLLTAADAYAAPPMALTVEGKSTQDGTPTPDAPVPIVSVDSVELHASADGTTDYGDWPVALDLDGHVLRSLPDGTKDTLALTYLRPSTRGGWAVYGASLTQRMRETTIDGNHPIVQVQNANYLRVNLNVPTYINSAAMADQLTWGNVMAPNSMTIGVNTTIYAWLSYSDFPTLADYKAHLAEHPMTLLYALATPVTTDLGEVELPVLPAPNCTVWADPTTGLQMEYVRDSNLAYARLEAALADLATS